MDKKIFDRMFPKDKGGFPDMLCGRFMSTNEKADYKEEKKIRAAIFIGFNSIRNAERFAEYERSKGIQYCEMLEYKPIAVIEAVSEKSSEGNRAIKKVIELAEENLIDVVVLPTISGLAQNQEETFSMMDALYGLDVKIDWMGHGNLDQKLFELYIDESQKQEQEFEKILRESVSQLKNRRVY